ncbi:MAG: 5'-3' exonuclease H3TH domain-containing protein [bacterium]
MKTLLLVDGHALIYRAYFALPPFKTKSGFPTNVIYGFFTILQKTINDFKPEYVTILFDTPKPTFRNKLYKKYQINRPKSQDNMRIQIPVLKKILTAGNLYQLEKDGFEADDLIGTLTLDKKNSNFRKIILTGDKDIFQLVDNTTFVMTPPIGFSKGILYDKDEVIKKLNVNPNQIPDYKALAGDPSDNYPGAKGIGPKTAAKLIKEYQTIEILLEQLQNVHNPKTKNLLGKNKKNILVSKKLAIIKRDVNIKFETQKARFLGFNHKIKKELLNLGMIGLIKRLYGEKKELNSKVKDVVKKVKKEDQATLF